uniref:Uncharacterized protein n=1 Tax=uncultured marine virus TaxID=186617 RepID=A0A0F7L4I4_9VIRU|nr:hypothetical protein [uncultured marine virus]
MLATKNLLITSIPSISVENPSWRALSTMIRTRPVSRICCSSSLIRSICAQFSLIRWTRASLSRMK